MFSLVYDHCGENVAWQHSAGAQKTDEVDHYRRSSQHRCLCVGSPFYCEEEENKNTVDELEADE